MRYLMWTFIVGILINCPAWTIESANISSINETAIASYLNVTNIWARPAPKAHNSALYMTIENNFEKDICLTSAVSSGVTRIDLHETKCKGQRCRMIPMSKIICPAHSKTELKAGGLHIMLIRLKQALKLKDTLPVRLEFSNGESISIDAPIQKSKSCCCSSES